MAIDASTAFVSYNRADAEFVLRLAEDLKAAGADVWVDQSEPEPGTPLDIKIQEALAACPKVLIILSPASVNSGHVHDEVSFALSKQKSVIPVLCRNCEIPSRLRRFQYIDFRTDYASALAVLLRTLGVVPLPRSRPEPITVFYSYSHKDEDLRNELDAHLAALRRSGLIREWHDRKILAGQEWEREISRYLDSAQLILFLLSADFVNSSYCVDVEVKRALEKQSAGEAVVVPVILRPVVWGIIPQFNRLQALPKDARPVTEWPSHDLAFVSVCEGILALVTRGRTTTRRTLSGSRARRRFLDAALPARVPVGKPSTLLVMIRRTDSPGLRGIVEAEPSYQVSENDVDTKPLTLKFPVDRDGTSQPLDLVVKVESPEFEPKSQVKEISVPPRGDSEPLLFLLTPTAGGPLLVNLEVLLGSSLIAGCLLRTQGESPKKTGSFPDDPERQRIGTNYIRDSKYQEHSEKLFTLFSANYTQIKEEDPYPQNVVSAPLLLSASEDEVVQEPNSIVPRTEADALDGVVRAPSPAVVVSVAVKPGDVVSIGDQLAVLEAMKMETRVVASFPGKVRHVMAIPNVQVSEGAPLLQIEPVADRQDSSNDIREVVVTNIQEIQQDVDLSFHQKREMIKREFAGLVQSRKNEIDSKVRIQEHKLLAEETVALRAIDAYKHKLIFQIDDDFNEVMRKLGTKVIMKRLEVWADIGEKLRAFADNLKKRKMKKRFTHSILAEVDRTFDSIGEQLGKNMADSIVDVPAKPPRNDKSGKR